MQRTEFQIGDRVRVSDSWFQEDLRGAVGTVCVPPEEVADRRTQGIHWVEFDEPWPGDGPAHATEAADIEGSDLQLVLPTLGPATRGAKLE